jgi:hypothetical protein
MSQEEIGSERERENERVRSNLKNEDEADEESKIRGGTINSTHDRESCLSNRDNHGQH